MLIRVITLFLVLGWIAPPSLRAQSPQVLTDALQSLADAVVQEVEQGGKKKIAVIPFQDMVAERETMFGRYIAEELVTRLFQNRNVEIVERQRLDMLLAEAKLGTTGLIDPSTARQIGKVAGVEALVMGTITDLQSFVAVNARLVDTQTGQIFGAAQVKVVRDDDVKKILALSLPGVEGSRAAGTSESVQGGRKLDERPAPIQRTVVDDITYELLACHGDGLQITCEFQITNGGEDRDYRVYVGGSRAFDDKGYEYAVKYVEIANTRTQRQPWIEKRLVTGVPTPLRVRIETMRRVERLSLLELRLHEGVRFGYRGNLPADVVQFRSIPVKQD